MPAGAPDARARRPAARAGLAALAAAAALVAAVPAEGALTLTGPPRALANPPPSAAAAAVDNMVRGLSAGVSDLDPLTRAAPRSTPARLSRGEAIDAADDDPTLLDWLSGHPAPRRDATYDSTNGVWTVSFTSGGAGGKTVTQAQVLVNDATADVTEVRTGPQVAWMMARGYPGAFGRGINKPAVWLTLCALFLLPMLRWRRLWSLRTLDLLALLGFSVSLVWFNRGEIFTSVPLQYPPLVYLGGRLAWIGLRRARSLAREADGDAAAPGPRRPRFAPAIPTWAMVTLLLLSLGIRYGLNAFDSNVIDVGYAGVIGAHRIDHGQTPYGTFPSDCNHCDTYGPLNYLAYVPFEAIAPWSGRWDDLPAAHAAATVFDLLVLAGLLTLGWRLSGLRLGVALALAWGAFPFTAYALESNANDALIAAILVWGLVLARRPLGRGAMLGLALAAKFAPAILLPLWSRAPFPRARRRRRGWLAYGGGLALAVVATGWVLLLSGTSGLRAFWSRTVGFQLGRDSPFSIWGQHPGLRPVQLALMALVAVAALALVRWPRRLDLLSFAALSGALVIGVELTLTHWFYLYIPWFLPFALLALVPEWPARIAPAPVAPSEPREARLAALPR